MLEMTVIEDLQSQAHYPKVRVTTQGQGHLMDI